ncbi:YeeE/YedE family protein [Albitalea terrae]|uniref:YeeE/YedE family protein n=2 Tax=Piscinibacter terrae TaxID=2496871 RepID=A0A3N7K538_9BURK|nr:YeeE/YedE family protein [Albitalea terrae]
MTIDWTAFTPWTSLAGGALIGMAVAMLVLLNGRIAGISGIVGGLLRPAAGDIAWRAAFVAGLLASPLLFTSLFTGPAAPQSSATPLGLVVAGCLVGLGTRYGSGCTSGHGVCGVARLSPRSIVATLTFMAMGFITAYVTLHLRAW